MNNNGKKKTIVILGIVLFLCIAGLIAVLIVTNPSVKVPDFSGMSLMEAEQYGLENDFVVKEGQKVDGNNEDKGTIVEQYPSAGTEITKGDAVIVKISRGLGDGRTPDVIGMTTEKATKAIEKAGFEVGSVVEVQGVETRGTVVAQSPKGDKELEKGSYIDLEVSDGTLIYAPNVVGMLEEDAVSVILENGLDVGYSGNGYSDKYDYGYIMKQTPAAGTPIERGSMIQIHISLGSEDDW